MQTMFNMSGRMPIQCDKEEIKMLLRGDIVPCLLTKLEDHRVFYERRIFEDFPSYFKREFSVRHDLGSSIISRAFASSLRSRTTIVLQTSSLFANIDKFLYFSLLRLPTVFVAMEYIGRNPEEIFSSEKFFEMISLLPSVVFYPKNLEEFLYMIIIAHKVSERLGLPSVIILERSLRRRYSPIEFPEDTGDFLGGYPQRFEFEGALGCEMEEEDFQKIISDIEKTIEQSGEEIRKAILEFEMKVDKFGNLFLDTRLDKKKEVFLTVGSLFYEFENAIGIKILKPFPRDSLKRLTKGKGVQYMIRQEGLKEYIIRNIK